MMKGAVSDFSAEISAAGLQPELLGTIVISKKGRDCGKTAVIAGWLQGDFALVADGKKRTIDKPKKKNMKHLEFTRCRPEALNIKLRNGEPVTDSMIREELAAFGNRRDGV